MEYGLGYIFRGMQSVDEPWQCPAIVHSPCTVERPFASSGPCHSNAPVSGTVYTRYIRNELTLTNQSDPIVTSKPGAYLASTYDRLPGQAGSPSSCPVGRLATRVAAHTLSPSLILQPRLAHECLLRMGGGPDGASVELETECPSAMDGSMTSSSFSQCSASVSLPSKSSSSSPSCAPTPSALDVCEWCQGARGLRACMGD